MNPVIDVGSPAMKPHGVPTDIANATNVVSKVTLKEQEAVETSKGRRTQSGRLKKT